MVIAQRAMGRIILSVLITAEHPELSTVIGILSVLSKRLPNESKLILLIYPCDTINETN